MSLIEAVTNVANEATYKVDTTVIASTDVTTKQLLAIANRVIREMSDAYNWPKLRKTGSFTLTDSVSTYALPGDFSFYHYETFWNQSEGWRLFGPMSSQQYAENIGFGDTSTVYDEFTIRGMTDNEITIYPTPGTDVASDVIVFQYTSNRPVRPKTWATGQSITSGQYRFYNGNYYVATTTGTTGATPPTHTTDAPVSDGGVTWDYYEGAYSTFLADTDEPVLPQRILEQGMLERFAELHALTVAPRFLDQLQDEYSKQVPGKILYAGGVRHREQYANNGRVIFGGRFN